MDYVIMEGKQEQLYFDISRYFGYFLFNMVLVMILSINLFNTLSNSTSSFFNSACFVCGEISVFETFIEEFVFLASGIIVGILLSYLIVKLIEKIPAIKFILNIPGILHILLVIPLYMILNSSLGDPLIYDGSIDKTVYQLFPIFTLSIGMYILFIILNEFKSHSNMSINFVLTIIRKKLPFIINYSLFYTIMLNLPFSAKLFVTDIMRIEYASNIMFPGYLFAILLQLLIIQIILTIIINNQPPSQGEIIPVKIKNVKIIIITILILYLFFIRWIYKTFERIGFSFIKKISNLYNPLYSNMDARNLPPDRTYYLGTNEYGIDILSLIKFSFGVIIGFVVVISLLRYLIAVIMKRILQKMGKKNRLALLEGLSNYPSIPILMLIGFAYSGDPVISQLYGVFGLISILSWSESAYLMEINDMKLNSRSIFLGSIFTFSIATLIIESSLLAYLGFVKQDLVIGSEPPLIGSVIMDAISNQPLINYWGVLYPLLSLIVITEIFRTRMRTV